MLIANLYALYGEERMNYVLANTVQMSDGDGRYSPGNKAWAEEININNAEDDRREFYVNSHPAVLDSLITAYRKHVKEFKEQSDKEENKEQMSENTRDYTKITARGDKVVNMKKTLAAEILRLSTARQRQTKTTLWQSVIISKREIGNRGDTVSSRRQKQRIGERTNTDRKDRKSST